MNGSPRAPRRPRQTTELRDAIARYLLKHGPAKATAIRVKVGVGQAKLYEALKNAWFASANGVWDLTPGGRTAAEVVAAAP